MVKPVSVVATPAFFHQCHRVRPLLVTVLHHRIRSDQRDHYRSSRLRIGDHHLRGPRRALENRRRRYTAPGWFRCPATTGRQATLMSRRRSASSAAFPSGSSPAIWPPRAWRQYPVPVTPPTVNVPIRWESQVPTPSPSRSPSLSSCTMVVSAGPDKTTAVGFAVSVVDVAKRRCSRWSPVRSGRSIPVPWPDRNQDPQCNQSSPSTHPLVLCAQGTLVLPDTMSWNAPPPACAIRYSTGLMLPSPGVCRTPFETRYWSTALPFPQKPAPRPRFPRCIGTRRGIRTDTDRAATKR